MEHRIIFQSTHPLQGVTEIKGIDVSAYQDFNPHTLCRVWPRSRDTELHKCFISIHTPFAGCDRPPWVDPDDDIISIHTPFAGCDLCQSQITMGIFNFNPHTLCRVWQTTGIIFSAIQEFQSTHPLQGVTNWSQIWRCTCRDFNPHTLCRVWRDG